MLPQPSPWRATFGADTKTITLSLHAQALGVADVVIVPLADDLAAGS
jgi:hypothetical protein